MTPLLSETLLPIERHGRPILRANQQLNLVRPRLPVCPREQGGKQTLPVTLAPMAKVNTHVQPQDVRDVPQAHGIETGMCDTRPVLFYDKVLGFALGSQCHTLCEGRFREFVGL